jgi:spermidine/putrescine transport system substrate-binding protein
MSSQITRKALLQRGAAGVTVLSLPGLLAACGGGGGGDGGDGGELKDVLNFSNWELYIDTPSTRKAAGLKGPTTLQQFTAKTGIKVNYYEDVNDNSGYFAKVQGRLSRGDGIDRDIIVSTDNDRFLGEYITNDWALKLDKSLIPNISNLIDAQASPPFDPSRDYSLPWFSGMDGIAWNEDLTDPVTTVTQLLEDPKLKGKVGVWNSMGDTLGLIMLENGDDPAKVTDATFDRALAVVQKAQDAGQIRRFYGNDYAQPLATGDLAASMAWSGDIFALQVPKVKWGIAEKGGIIWTDNMLIPLGGSVPTASTYMNFVYDPKIAAELALGGGYISSVKGVREEAVKLDPNAEDNTLVFPTDEMFSQMHQNDPTMFSNPEYEKRWLAVQGK